MKIGIFTDFYLSSSIGGTETAVHNLAEALREQGHHVIVFTPNYFKKNTAYMKGVEFLPSIYWFKFANAIPMLPALGYTRKMYSLELDVIHVHSEFQAGVLGLKLARKLKIPSVHTAHTIGPSFLAYQKFKDVQAWLQLTWYRLIILGFQPPKLKQVTPLFTRNAWRSLIGFARLADYTISPSEHLAQKLIKYGLNHNVKIVPNAVALGRFKSAVFENSDTVDLIAVGRLSPEKRLDILLRALVKTSNSKIRLQIVGSGSQGSKLQKLVSNLGIQHQVKFLGARSQTEVAKLLSVSNIFCIMSNGFDNQPVSIIEALASGLPVLYCDPDLKEGLTSNNSFLSKPEVSSVAETLNIIYNKRSKLKMMGSSALTQSQQFSYKKQAQATLDVYKQLIAK